MSTAFSGLVKKCAELAGLIQQHQDATRGEITSLLLSSLRDAGEPVATEEMTRPVMVARGRSPADKTLFKLMLQRIHSCLRNHRKHRRVRSAKSQDRKFSRWEVAR